MEITLENPTPLMSSLHGGKSTEKDYRQRHRWTDAEQVMQWAEDARVRLRGMSRRISAAYGS
jgi:hypothetical protein